MHEHVETPAARTRFGARMRFGALATAACLLIALSATAQEKVKTDVVYIPTPQDVVDGMLKMAGVKKGDYLIDLGSGDGRMVVTAAKAYGARGFGVDIDPKRVEEANENARLAGVTDQVEFRIQNLYETDISKADVLTLYLLTEINMKLRPTILSTMRPGSRVVSHAFDMGEWKADQEHRFQATGRRMLFWVVPAKVEGAWKVDNGESNFVLNLSQNFQQLTGAAEINGKSTPIENGRLNGSDITFAINLDGKQRTFQGRVDGNAITAPGWKATRL